MRIIYSIESLFYRFKFWKKNILASHISSIVFQDSIFFGINFSYTFINLISINISIE